MNRLTPQSIAILASIALALVAAIGTAASDYLRTQHIDAGNLILQATLSLSAGYAVIYVAIKYFFHDSLSSLYKTIEEVKSEKSEINIEDIPLDEDLLRKVRQDVLKWALERRNEVEQLRKMEAYRREFVGNVSHELKTPIFNIQGYISTLLDGGLEDPAINRNYLERASRSVDRMISLVEDLDVISQIESGQLQPYPEKYDLITQIKEILVSLDMKSAQKKITFLLETAPEKLFVHADKNLIRQVFTNLLVNSIKYGKEGGLTKIRLKESVGQCLVEIEDNGLGIARQHLPRIFERFYRVDKGRSREHGGTGLGLAIVKHIMESHNQSIDVRSELGQGTTFIFSLKTAAGES